MSRKTKYITVGVILVLFLAARALLHVFTIPQAGMFPTYPPGTKLVGLAFLWTPASVERGDVVIYTERRQSSDYDFIWRVVGLPGETVEVRDDVVLVNGEPLLQDVASTRGEYGIRREHAGAQSYLVAVPIPGKAKPDATNYASVSVPAGSVFLLGDNRHNAHDSRATGAVPLTALRARALFTLSLGEGQNH